MAWAARRPSLGLVTYDDPSLLDLYSFSIAVVHSESDVLKAVVHPRRIPVSFSSVQFSPEQDALSLHHDRLC